MKKIKKVLVANRGEIAIRIFRACEELNLKTVAIYSEEDKYSIHRFKADEAYLIKNNKKKLIAYMNDDLIINIAKKTFSDAIHPGYGFLSENKNFAYKCKKNNIIFIGPEIFHLDIFGNKIKAKNIAKKAGLFVIPGLYLNINKLKIEKFIKKYGFPLIIKTIFGGGGKGIKIFYNKIKFLKYYNYLCLVKKNDKIYIEKYIDNAKHIEVQIISDYYKNIIHLYERDCSIQRRNQKMIEIAPCIILNIKQRLYICNLAIKLMKFVKYVSIGTVEFLYKDNKFFFIEVNPRLQVEHTITEIITNIDIVKTQIMISDKMNLHSEIGIPKQNKIFIINFAIQCRITTEDPINDFYPSIGTIDTYRSPGGFGVRLDVGNAYTGYKVNTYFDSLLVKLTTFGRTFFETINRMKRCLNEFIIYGIKTNILFLKILIEDKEFLNGFFNINFLERKKKIIKKKMLNNNNNEENKILRYISEITLKNNNYKIKKKNINNYKINDIKFDKIKNNINLKEILEKKGVNSIIEWIKKQKNILLTDTTFRDAQQSLIATRLRSKDILNIASVTAKFVPQFFSNEMWGGATFDVAYRFLLEDPWERLKEIRKLMPNILLQMLLRGSNIVGYKSFPENVVKEFIKIAVLNGIDIFRIFDSLNLISNLENIVKIIKNFNRIVEVAICYTGNIFKQYKYNIEYYKNLVKKIENIGADIIVIKDMAGLLTPKSAYYLISEIKCITKLPINLHFHDISGNGIAVYLSAIKAGVNIVDVAFGNMASGLSQPSINSLYFALKDNKKNINNINIKNVEKINKYWKIIRQYYYDFDDKNFCFDTEVYIHEIPGGQYTNLKDQAKNLNIYKKWEEIKIMYHKINLLFGDVIKVTPISKVIGDMTLFMIKNNLKIDDLYNIKNKIIFPESVISFFNGFFGIPFGGFPKKIKNIILKNNNNYIKKDFNKIKFNFNEIKNDLEKLDINNIFIEDILSYIMFPQVFLIIKKILKNMEI